MIAAPAGPRRWPRSRWVLMIALVFAAHLGLIAAFNDSTPILPRIVARVPQLRLTAGVEEWLALNDPTLFVLPHPRGFTGAVWAQMPQIEFPVFAWTDAPRWLELPVEELGEDFARFMQTNRIAGLQLEPNPPPPLASPTLAPEPAFPAQSTLRIEGDLAHLRLLNRPDLPTWPMADLVAPSRVQVRVDASGSVLSAVLLPPENPLAGPSHYPEADLLAVKLARTSRFERLPLQPPNGEPNPAARVTWGRMIFQWQTVPLPSTNASAGLPH